MPDRARVEQWVVENLKGTFGRKTVELSDNLIVDYGADSLDLVEVVMDAEDEFDINISDEDAEKVKTVEDIINYVMEHSRQE